MSGSARQVSDKTTMIMLRRVVFQVEIKEGIKGQAGRRGKE